MSTSTRSEEGGDWIKLDLHIHTLDDPKDKLDYSAHELLARARRLGFSVLAITLHDAVFDRPEVFAAAQRLGMLLISAADIILLNVTAEDVEGLRTFKDVRQLRSRRAETLFTIAPHPFYLLGGSIGKRLLDEIDCFDAIELCHFHKGFFNPNRQAMKVAERFGKPLVATSDAHQLNAFGRHYTTIPRPSSLTAESIFAQLRTGRLRINSPAATFQEIISTFYFVFIEHPLRCRFHH
jgi:predicted metal-dependent phosphoesterase TrpH